MDIQNLKDHVSLQTIYQIKVIPLNHTKVKDRLVWHFTKNGTYIVKSGYPIALDHCKSSAFE